MKYVVGYSHTARGTDALNLGISLARSLGAELEVVLVLKNQHSGISSASMAGSYGMILRQQADTWLDEAKKLVPEGVKAHFQVRQAESTAQCLMDVAEVINAGLIIVGGAKTGGWFRHSLGSVGNALLHRAKLPVVLAPHDWDSSTEIKEIDCAVSTEFDAIGLVEEAIATQNRTGLAVRLVSMAEGSDPESKQVYRDAVRDLVTQSSVTPHDPEKLTIEVGVGATIPEAVDDVEWIQESMLMAGSSKLAQKGELFLSSTTAKIMTKLPVPLLVVPRDYHPGRYGSQQEPWTGSLPVIKQ